MPVMMQPTVSYTITAAGGTYPVNTWWRVIDGVRGLTVKRILIQVVGSVKNGKLYLSSTPPAGATDVADAIVLDASAPAAGPSLPVTFIDEDTSGRCDNHHGEWWVNGDTVGLQFSVTLWV